MIRLLEDGMLGSISLLLTSLIGLVMKRLVSLVHECVEGLSFVAGKADLGLK